MDIHEYDTKMFLRKFGIPVNLGDIAITPEDAENIAYILGGDVYLKAQILRGHRMKLGAIERAETPVEARVVASRLLGRTIAGYRVNKVLVDPTIEIKQELYLSITNDRYHAKELFMASSSGGIEVISRPDTIQKEYIDPLLGLHNYQIVKLANNMELPRQYWPQFIEICSKLYRIYRDSDATLLEINPLVITTDDRLIALDAKLSIDDNALYRQPSLAAMRDTTGEPMSVTMAREHGIHYVKLDGQIGIMVNGAGLAMSTIDMIDELGDDFGIGAANFIDIGGGPTVEKVAESLRIILADEKVKVIILNIFGGTTRCDVVAEGVIKVYQQYQPDTPLIIRMKGTNADEGCQMMHDAFNANQDIIHASTLTEIAKKAIHIVKRKVHV